MGDALMTLGPMFLFMLVPIWIPMIAVAVGWLWDLVAPAKPALVKVDVEAGAPGAPDGASGRVP